MYPVDPRKIDGDFLEHSKDELKNRDFNTSSVTLNKILSKKND